MATLYDLTGIYEQIYDLNIDEQAKQDTLESMDWQEDFDNKIENYIKVVKNFEADKAMIDDEIKRLKARKDNMDNQIKRVKEAVKNAMVMTNNTKVKTPLFSISVANNKASVVIDETILPNQFFVEKIERKPDKDTLYTLLKNGEKIKGAELNQTQSLRIR